MKSYHVTVVDGEAELHGPYENENERSRVAKHFWFGATMQQDTILKLDIDDKGVPVIGQYEARELDPLHDFLQQPRLFDPEA